MATLHPFRALRPVPARAEEVASVPYDVISTAEARTLAEGKPLSFLHVIRPEIDLPEGVDEHAEAVYEKGAENLRALVASEATVREEAPSLYIYRLVMGARAQTGVFGCVSVAEYDDGLILKHEKTRPVKEDDRTRHILTQRAHAEPVMLTYRDDAAVDRIVEEAQQQEPLYDFAAEDGVQHTIWRVGDREGLVDAFGSVPKLYVADGHHRCKAASRAAAGLRGEDGSPGEADFFPAVLFPMGQMHIMAYNRIVYDLPMDADAFLDAVGERAALQRDVADPEPQRRGQVGLYLGDGWHRLTLPETTGGGVASGLDAARLGEHVLEPLLGIEDLRRDPNIDFVGGIRGTDELERRVDSGEADLALAMFPTSIEELLDVSDAGELMPPKSTWFEPKLRSGLLVHLFE